MERVSRGPVPRWVWIVGLVLLAVVAFHLMARPTPGRVVSRLIDAALSGDHDAAMRHITSRSRYGSVLPQWHVEGRPGAVTDYAIAETSVEGDDAQVTVVFDVVPRGVESTAATPSRIVYRLHREDGVWRVDLDETWEDVLAGDSSCSS